MTTAQTFEIKSKSKPVFLSPASASPLILTTNSLINRVDIFDFSFLNVEYSKYHYAGDDERIDR